MHIEKQYEYYREKFTDYFCLKISVKEDDQNGVSFLRSTVDLVDKDTVWISIKNLNDEEFLKQHQIEYIVKVNESDKSKEIIPIGLFEFNDGDFRYSELFLWNIGSQDLYKAERIVKNVEDAIKIKYEALKFKNKCIKNFIDNTVKLD